MGKNINIDYLRFSLTNKCNLNCIYCNPLEKKQFVEREKILTHEEMIKIVQLFVKKGIKNLRLTGGEPLLKKDLALLIKMFRKIKSLKDISITTNGVLLKDMAKILKKNGLDRINISLDTLQNKKFEKITGKDYFNDVWQGIENALKYGLHPVKLNVILMKGINNDEIPDFAQLTKEYNLIVRFIELFPTSRSRHVPMRDIQDNENIGVGNRSIDLSLHKINFRRNMNNFMSHKMTNKEAKEIIENHYGKLKPVLKIRGNGPAEYFKLKNAKGSIGFISNLSEYFCDKCNRIRINCAGLIAPCLFSGYIYDIKPLLHRNETDGKLLNFITEIIQNKQKYKKNPEKDFSIEMSSIGG